MTSLEKQRMIHRFSYTWPLYVVLPVLVSFLLSFIFGIVHRVPNYKTLTIFVSGEVTDVDKLKDDMLSRFKEKEIKTFSSISSLPTDPAYYTKLSVAGNNSSDVLILPISITEEKDVSVFSLDLSNELKTLYSGYSFYSQNDVSYGVKIDKEKVKQYMTLPSEDGYMFLNGGSENIGEYSLKNTDKNHDMAIQLVKDWGM